MAKKKKADEAVEGDSKPTEVGFALRFDDPNLYAALGRYAKSERRTRNATVLHMIEAALRKAGFFPLKDEPDP